MLVLEVGFKLDKSLIHHHDMLIRNGLTLDFSCITHDIYYTDKSLDGLTENQMKNSCIRLRYCDGINKEISDKTELDKKEK